MSDVWRFGYLCLGCGKKWKVGYRCCPECKGPLLTLTVDHKDHDEAAA